VAQAAAIDVTRFIDDQPVSRLQLRVALLCGVVVFVDGYDAQAMGYVAPALTADLGIARSLLGPVISAGLVGMMIGALVCGPLADRVGRKPILVGCVLTFGLGALLTATAGSLEALVAYRVLTGLGMGGAMPNAIALTSEYMPRTYRATAVTTMICGFALGAAAGGWVAASIIPMFGWQSVFIVGGIFPCLVAVAATAWLPESIRFLLVAGGREAQATQLLSAIAADGSAPEHVSAAAGEPGGRGAFVVAQLFDRRTAGTLLIWTIYFMNLLNLYFLNNWLPTIMSDIGIRVETAIRVTSLFQVGGIAGAIVLGRLLDVTRSFWVLAGCFFWAAAWVLLTGQVGASVPLLAATVFCAGVGVVGGQNASHALTAEFYPTGIRSTGVGWALGIGRIGSIVGPILGGYLLVQGGGATQVFWAAAIPAAIAGAAAVALTFITRSQTAAP
jgi:AAHS family 4-hydroxybenzoate transporter-like MFS transporter